jgi:hypothetical protein
MVFVKLFKDQTVLGFTADLQGLKARGPSVLGLILPVPKNLPTSKLPWK